MKYMKNFYKKPRMILSILEQILEKDQSMWLLHKPYK